MSRALTVRGATRPDGAPVELRAVDGRIVELGPVVAAQPGDEVLDAAGNALLAGLVNGHTHAAMTLFRGYGGDLPLMAWLEQKIWPAEARLTDDDVYWGTRLACVEMIRTGTVRFWDMYWRPLAVARAVRDAGLRATLGPPIIDGFDDGRGRDARAYAVDALEHLDGFDPRVEAALAPHGIYTVGHETLAWVAEESDRRDLPVQLHFLETEDELAGCAERVAGGAARYLDRIGLLSPRLVLAHAVWVTDDDLDLLAASATTVVTNPVSNLKLAVGRVFPYLAARARGIPVGLGTDGAASNNGLDLFQDVKVFALIQKAATRDPAHVTASEAWAVATGALAPCLGGTFPAVGERADFVLVRSDVPELAPGHLVDNLVYAAAGSVVANTVVDGVVLLRDGVVEGEEEVRARATECARRLGVV